MTPSCVWAKTHNDHKDCLLVIGNHRCWCCRHSFDTEAEPASPPPHQVEFRASLPTTNKHLVKPQVEKLRRISTGSMKIEVTGEKTSLDSHVTSFKKCKQVYFESGEGGIYNFIKIWPTYVPCCSESIIFPCRVILDRNSGLVFKTTPSSFLAKLVQYVYFRLSHILCIETWFHLFRSFATMNGHYCLWVVRDSSLVARKLLCDWFNMVLWRLVEPFHFSCPQIILE